MKIYAKDKRSWIEIEHYGDENYSSFTFEVFIDIGHGKFHGKNIDVHFLNVDSFIQKLECFKTDKTIVAMLTGTYDNKIWFYAPIQNSIMIGFSLGDTSVGDIKTIDYKISGSIEITPNLLDRIIEEFKMLF